MKITVYRAEDGWRWRARAANGEIVSESGEAYENKAYVVEAARRFGPGDAEMGVEFGSLSHHPGNDGLYIQLSLAGRRSAALTHF
jgi:uncharacterized protein YegP (UPF0339 family)